MKRFVRVVNGVVEHATEADSAPAGYIDALGTHASPGWTYDGSTFSHPPATAPQAERVISRQEFIDRWTFDELVLMRKKASTDDAAAVYWELVVNRDMIDLDSANSQAAKPLLVSWGVLTADRVTQIFG